MPRMIEADDVQRLLREDGAQLVEVLPPEEYDEGHLPGAINIPLDSIDTEAPERLDRNRPVIVYCWDDP